MQSFDGFCVFSMEKLQNQWLSCQWNEAHQLSCDITCTILDVKHYVFKIHTRASSPPWPMPHNIRLVSGQCPTYWPIWDLWPSQWQAITLTSDIPTWRIKCPQSRKNCQIYPTKCRKNVMERKFLFSIISYWFSAWIKPCKPRFIMGENGGCWQSCRSWPQTLPLNCSNQFTLMPLFFSHVN